MPRTTGSRSNPHIQFDRQAGEIRILNAGSLGMPYADKPGACWLLLGPDGCEFRKTMHGREAAAEEIRNSKYPQAKELAEGNVHNVPSADVTIEVFEKLRNL